MNLAIWPLLVCVVGALVFLLGSKAPDVKALGKDMFWVGLLVFLVFLAPSWMKHLS